MKMTKVNIYTVYDVVAAEFGVPFFMKNDELAQRAFQNMAENPQTSIYENPADYVLYRIGTYDPKGADIDNEEVNHSLGNATLFKTADPTKGELHELGKRLQSLDMALTQSKKEFENDLARLREEFATD
jgi:hypothetical protein